LQFSLQANNPETFGYTLVLGSGGQFPRVLKLGIRWPAIPGGLSLTAHRSPASSERYLKAQEVTRRGQIPAQQEAVQADPTQHPKTGSGGLF